MTEIREAELKSWGKLTPARHQRIVEAVQDGNYKATAARLAGVRPETLYDWLRTGEVHLEAGDTDSPYARLYGDVERAEAEFEASMVKTVMDAGTSAPQNWPAAMTLLERRFPNRFGRRDTTILEGGDRPIPVATVTVLLDPEKRALANDLLSSLASGSRRELGPGSPEQPGRAGPGIESS